MKLLRQKLGIGATLCATAAVTLLISCSSTNSNWVDPANQSDQLITGP